MSSRTYNPEKRAWRGRSYKRGGEPVADLKGQAKEKDMSRSSEEDREANLDALESVKNDLGKIVDKLGEIDAGSLAAWEEDEFNAIQEKIEQAFDLIQNIVA